MPQNAKGRDSTAAGILRMFRADRLLLQTRKEDAPRGHQNIDRQQPATRRTVDNDERGRHSQLVDLLLHRKCATAPPLISPSRLARATAWQLAGSEASGPAG